MCGLAGGFDIKNDAQSMVAIALMAAEMETRGGDSWGSTDGMMITRCVGAITNGFVIPEVLPQNFALHTRYATQGKVKETNSHPFVISGKSLVVGMHNGIISNHDQLNQKYNRNLRVDSQHIFKHIADDESLDDIEGYGTIVYKKDDDWYLGSFNNGELSLAYTDHGTFFASTAGALMRALGTSRIEGNVFSLPQNYVYKLENGGFKEEYRLRIAPTQRKWTDKKGGQSYISKMIDSSTGRCIECEGLLWGDETDICDLCMKYGTVKSERSEKSFPERLHDEPEWDIEVVPEGAEIVCEDCGDRIREYETVAVYGNKYFCDDCLQEGGFNAFND